MTRVKEARTSITLQFCDLETLAHQYWGLGEVNVILGLKGGEQRAYLKAKIVFPPTASKLTRSVVFRLVLNSSEPFPF